MHINTIKIVLTFLLLFFSFTNPILSLKSSQRFSENNLIIVHAQVSEGTDPGSDNVGFDENGDGADPQQSPPPTVAPTPNPNPSSTLPDTAINIGTFITIWYAFVLLSLSLIFFKYFSRRNTEKDFKEKILDN